METRTLGTVAHRRQWGVMSLNRMIALPCFGSWDPCSKFATDSVAPRALDRDIGPFRMAPCALAGSMEMDQMNLRWESRDARRRPTCEWDEDSDEFDSDDDDYDDFDNDVDNDDDDDDDFFPDDEEDDDDFEEDDDDDATETDFG